MFTIDIALFKKFILNIQHALAIFEILPFGIEILILIQASTLGILKV